MPHKDRESFIALLEKLGHPDDPEALATARSIAHRVKEAGADWASLLAPTGVVHAQIDQAGETPPGHIHAGDEDEAAEASSQASNRASAPPGDPAGDLALIEKLLKIQTLSADTREMLEDFKQDIKQGEFAPADQRYLKSLEARLTGARKK